MTVSTSTPGLGGFRAGDALNEAARSVFNHFVAARRQQAEQRVNAYLYAMDDATLRRAGYSEDQIRKIRRGESPFSA